MFTVDEMWLDRCHILQLIAFLAVMIFSIYTLLDFVYILVVCKL